VTINEVITAELSKLFQEPSGVLNSALIEPILAAATERVFSFQKVAKPTNAEVMLTVITPTALLFKAGMARSVAKAGTGATAEAVFDLKKNGGTAFATITFAAEGTTGVFACAADTTFAAGDILTVVAPATADATLAALAVSITAYR
jgi:hypothetical protein